MKTKSVDIQVKAGPDDGLEDGMFEAYASVFGNVDSYGDVVKKGAFADSLKEWSDSGNTMPVLYGHNMSDPDYFVGGVVEAKEDDHGLRVKGQLDLDSPKASQVYRLLKGKRLSQLSFAYDVIDAAPGEVDGQKITELHKLKAYEISLVPIGANSATEVLGVKTAVEQLDAKSLTGDAVTTLRDAHQVIGDILANVEPDADADKASDEEEAKTEEPGTANVEEQKSKSSVESLRRFFQII